MGDDEFTTSSCTRWNLFPIASDTVTSYKHSIKSLRNCTTDICAAPTFNPDLGGIGVFTSLIMQVGIIIIAFLALLLLEKLPRLSKQTRELHIEALVTAMVEFHKYQCYFASSVQIATLMVFVNLQTYDVDIRLLGLLAINGIVPIIFTLACIMQHGRQSWYLIVLSVLTFLLSTATMVINIDNYYRPKSSIHGNVDDLQPYLEYLCQSNIVDLCGKPRDAIYGAYGLNLPLTFSAVWLYSSAWAVTYVLKKKFDNPGSSKWKKCFPLVWMMRLLVPRSYISDIAHKLWEILVLCLWAFCFAFQLYICKLYVNDSLISATWSVGQIVAVMIWLPSIVEFIYSEIGTVQPYSLLHSADHIQQAGVEDASEYRFPRPYKVVRELVKYSITMGNFKTPQPRTQRMRSSPPDRLATTDASRPQSHQVTVNHIRDSRHIV